MDPRPDIVLLKNVLKELIESEKMYPTQKNYKKYQKTVRYSISAINRLEKFSKKLERDGYYD